MVSCENAYHRANDEVSNAREQLQRTFGFAKGSGAVFAPQVETYETEISDFIFTDTFLDFGTFPRSLLSGWCLCPRIADRTDGSTCRDATF